MPRLTKSDIEGALLSGAAVPWTDAGGKSASIQLATAKQRRLFAYLRSSKIRDVKGLPQAFIDGLAATHVAVGDPAAVNVQRTVNPSASGPWKIHALKIEGFGGINIWNGKPFEFAIDTESLLIEGPNGSGKSSLNAAIIWALTGERPRDQGDSSLEEAKPVFDTTGKAAGAWPPVAAYPPNLASLKTPPNVSVEIVFSNAAGTQVSARRHFDGKNVTYTPDPALQIPTILLEAGLLMPARIPHLRLDDGRGRLTDAVQKLTGLDELIDLGAFIQGLIREYRHVEVKISPAFFAYANGEISTQMASIDVINTGSRPVSVRAPTLRSPNGKFLTFVGVDDFKKFPKRLNDGESASLCVTYAEIARTLKKDGFSGKVKLFPSCLDATDKRYWGKKWKLDVNKDWMSK